MQAQSLHNVRQEFILAFFFLSVYILTPMHIILLFQKEEFCLQIFFHADRTAVL